MHTFARNLHSAYSDLYEFVRSGRVSAPRGKQVTESTHPVVWTLDKPMEWCLPIPGRRINPFFAMAEVVWMWSGKGGVDFISYYNKSIAQFADNGIPYFNASYGKRVRHYGYAETPFRDTPFPRTIGQIPEPVEVDQLEFVISKLVADPDTRQAAVTLWDPIKDNFHTSKDYPCNNMLYFSQRDGKLNLSVVIRSNDLIWGTPYNMIQFGHLQALIAGSLGLELGWFTVMCNNLHMYHDLYPDTLKLVHIWVNDKSTEPEKYGHFWKTPDPRWALNEFTTFVREVWDVIEMDLRNTQKLYEGGMYKTQTSVGAAMNMIHMRLERQFNEFSVPEYWRAVFNVMFMYHLRKACQTRMFRELLETLPTQMFWAVQDFVTKKD